MRRSLVRAVVTLTAIGAFIVGSAAPAQAADPDYWHLNPTICRGCANTNTNLVRFWQAILWADNIGGGISGTGFIDGAFGPNTESKTKSWQGVHSDWNGVRLVQDGRVGPRTWWAGQWQGPVHCQPGNGPGEEDCTYYGDAGRLFHFERFENGGWIFYHPSTGVGYVIA
jgi:hypothetical protein